MQHFGQNKKDFAHQPGLSLSGWHERKKKKWRIHIINDEKVHDSIGKSSEKVENKVKNRVWGFAPCLASKRRSELCVSLGSRSVIFLLKVQFENLMIVTLCIECVCTFPGSRIQTRPT